MDSRPARSMLQATTAASGGGWQVPHWRQVRARQPLPQQDRPRHRSVRCPASRPVSCPHAGPQGSGADSVRPARGWAVAGLHIAGTKPLPPQKGVCLFPEACATRTCACALTTHGGVNKLTCTAPGQGAGSSRAGSSRAGSSRAGSSRAGSREPSRTHDVTVLGKLSTASVGQQRTCAAWTTA